MQINEKVERKRIQWWQRGSEECQQAAVGSIWREMFTRCQFLHFVILCTYAYVRRRKDDFYGINLFGVQHDSILQLHTCLYIHLQN